ncbi:MAG: glycosyltransferase family 4 protein [Candidatus Binataceae bacterium]
MASNPSQRLRIVGIDPERGFSGGESQVLGLTLELIRAGHQAELLCDPRGLLWRRAGAAGVVRYPLAIRNSLDARAGLKLRAFLRRGAYDVVHFHTARAHAMAPFAGGAPRRAGDRVLVVTRRMDYVPNRLFASWLYNHAVDAVAAISSGVMRALESAGVASGRITLIPSGVDCMRFRPALPAEREAARAALGIAADEVALGTVGALEARKGHRFLIDALSAIAGRGLAFRCFIVGAGSEREALAGQIRGLGLGNQVTLAGGVEDPGQLLSAIDVFVFPSLKEGLGVALMEAMACGIAPVASNTGGIPELIETGRSGLLVSPGSAAELANALEVLIAAPNMRREIGAAARARMVENFSMTAMAARTIELYRTSLERARAAKGGKRCAA